MSWTLSQSFLSYSSPVIKTIEMHTGGEPLRVIISGYPKIHGDTILQKRRYAKNNLDHLRKMLMFEPRGHNDMYGAVLVDTDLPGADIAVLFMHNGGYSTMCGHAIIALGRLVVDKKYVTATEPETEVNIQCPCGLVKTVVEYKDGKSGYVRFHSVPAFLFASNVEIKVKGYGMMTVDISYGGAFYAFISADVLGLDVRRSSTSDLKKTATAVSDAVKEQVKILHPGDDDLSFLYGTILTDGQDNWSADPTANVCVFADAQVDRSPTGSGVTARIALQHAKGFIQIGQKRIFESGVTKSLFSGTAIKQVKCNDFDAVVVEVSGQGHYTGEASFILEEGDIVGEGFLPN
ncbi:trans-L-3-hydroxyproline dehydratase-like [Antedon mediterranea]|uniref:trans-L-3-hydroxyproline dehydratase-like n=1 Tax=Antedon mediterranea TaxID=105859 RepID=UPI003AF624F0